MRIQDDFALEVSILHCKRGEMRQDKEGTNRISKRICMSSQTFETEREMAQQYEILLDGLVSVCRVWQITTCSLHRVCKWDR